jgi:hypothetical protein
MANRNYCATSLSDYARPTEVGAFSGGAKLGPGPMLADKAEPQGGLGKPESTQVMVGVDPIPPPARIDVSKPSSTVTKGIDTTTSGVFSHKFRSP